MNAPSSTESTALAVAARQQYDLSPRDFDEAWRMAEYLADSDMVPKDFKGKPGNCLVAVQWGAELGLKTMQAIQNIAVINGRPSLWGDVMLALVRSSPLCEYVIEEVTGTSATCKVKRRGEPEQARTFTEEDAKAAGLLNKDGPWKQYRKRMLQMRARAWALRDVFTDVLKGLHMAEEAMDMPPEKFMGAADVVQPQEKEPTTTLPAYSAEDFAKNFPAWQKAIEAQKKTPQDVLATLQTKFTLTEEQKAKVLSIKAKPQPTAQTVSDAQVKGEQPSGAPADDTGEITYAHVATKLEKAANPDALTLAGDLIKHVADETQRKELQAIYDRRESELNQG